tara:strand:+ start:341 stop:2374 length:2034 start_codon:yes stop_codon:yes gene_type:complete
MNILNAVQSALNTPSSLDLEIAGQLELARERIGNQQAAQKLVNQMVGLVPRLILDKDVNVSFTGDRDELITVSKDLNDIMWLIALQSTLQNGTATTSGLVSLFAAWALAEMKAVWSSESITPIAKRFIKEMINQNVLSSKMEARELTTGIRKVYVLSPATTLEVSDMVDELRASVPMQCKPLTNQPTNWTDNNTGIHADAKISLITGSKQKTVAPAVLSAVNKLQAVSFVVSPAIQDAADILLDNLSEYGVTEEDARIYRAVAKLASDECHFPITMDKRGRMYYRGGLVTPQGTDFCKAAFQFKDAVALGETGFDAIAIHTANVCGMDKETMDDRISWTMANIDSGTFAAITDFEDVMQTFPNADTFQATVAILEINRILALDTDPALVTSTLVCHQDGTCNGLQHMAAITGSRETAESVNCVASTWSDTPSDIYGVIATVAAEMAAGDVSALIAKYGRDMAKNPVMIVGYGAGEETVIANTAKFISKKGENVELAEAVGKAYMAALEVKAAAVKSFTSAITRRMDMAMQAGLTSAQWTTADGFVCDIEYTSIEDSRIRAGAFNAVKAGAVGRLDEVKTRGAMAPNLIHSVDAAHLRMVVNNVDHELVTVHDSIGSHAGNFFKTASAIRTQFVAVHEYDILTELCTSMDVKPINFVAKRRAGGYNASEALNSTYIFS